MGTVITQHNGFHKKIYMLLLKVQPEVEGFDEAAQRQSENFYLYVAIFFYLYLYDNPSFIRSASLYLNQGMGEVALCSHG